MLFFKKVKKPVQYKNDDSMLTTQARAEQSAHYFTFFRTK